MITKEAIEAGMKAAIDKPLDEDDVERILTAAIAAMPGPAVRVEYANRSTGGFEPAPDLASENERMRKALEFVQLWAWREDPPNANRKLTDEERLSAIKHHPSIRPDRAALERT